MEVDKRSGIRLHAWDFTFSRELLPDVKNFLEAAFGDLPEAAEMGRNRRYDTGQTWGGGSGLFWSLDAPECFVCLKGSILDEAPIDAVWDVAEWLERNSPVGASNYRTTHFDVAFDDYSWLMTPSDLWDQYAEKRYFGPFRTRMRISGGGEDESQGDGYTILFGKRGRAGGGVQFCVYDKKVESCGEIDAVRYEARFFGDKAEVNWQQTVRGAGSVESFTAGLGRLVAGAIDFYKPFDRSDRHADRRTIAPFWQAIKDYLGGGTRFGLVRELSDDLVDLMSEARRSMSQKLAMIVDGLDLRDGEGAGEKWVRDLIYHGRSVRGLRWENALEKVERRVVDKAVEIQLPIWDIKAGDVV